MNPYKPTKEIKIKSESSKIDKVTTFVGKTFIILFLVLIFVLVASFIKAALDYQKFEKEERKKFEQMMKEKQS